jgi:5-amino-6-(5-phospho-D-ribitylamino)uracil phosphatase
MSGKITNVVFDFGGVIAPADLGKVLDRFRALGFSNIENYLNLVRQQGFFGDFESGLIDKEEFRRRVSEEVGHEVTMEECRDAYVAFFDVIPEQNLALLRRLRAEGYRLSLLSNTNPFVTDWSLSKAFDGHGHSLDEYLDSLYLSFEYKVMKPEEKIFRIMLEGEGVAPENVLYVDDGPKNVEAARKIGIESVLAVEGEDWTKDVERILGLE